MAKPIGPVCNLDCRYCYYLHKRHLLGKSGQSSWRMDDWTLECYIKQHIESQEICEIQFAWQGGESTLMGLGFFKRVVELQRKYCPPGKRVVNALQTNGALLDDRWAAFFKEHDFLVGISIDGPRAIHDQYRVDKAGRPSFDQVMSGRRYLIKHDVPHNALVCIHRHNGDRAREVYRFLRNEKFEWIQFIPVVATRDFEQKSPGADRPAYQDYEEAVTDWSVLPSQYAEFLIAVFDQWVRQDVGRIFVQIFEECAAIWVHGEASLCVFRPTCGTAMALEHDGSLFACDHYVYPDHKLGNIHEDHLRDLAARPFQRTFGQAKADNLPRCCHDCSVRFACNGGCPKDRFMRSPDGEPGLHYLCEAYKRFFTHVDPYMRALNHLIRSGRPATDLSEIAHKMSLADAGADYKRHKGGGRPIRDSIRRRKRASRSRW